MFTRKLAAISISVALLASSHAVAAPTFSRGIKVGNVIAYQDDQDPAQFFYIPARSAAGLADRITTFRATHFGLGRIYLVQSSSGAFSSRVGAILSGTVAIDISDQEQTTLIEAIRTTLGVEQPRLLPLPLQNVRITSMIAGDLVGFGDAVTQNLPSTLQFGTETAYSVGSLNSGFAQLVGQLQVGGGGMAANPHFAINIEAEAEFVGDPWTATIDCDLSRVWDRVRTNVGGSVSLGWFRIGSASYERIAADLQQSGACSFSQEGGTLDLAEPGRPVLEMVRDIFTQINSQALAGENFFRFEPPPEAPQAPSTRSADLFGWGVSLNGAYGSTHFNQEIRWQTTVSYSGHIIRPVTAAVVLAVNCGQDTRQLFQDLSDVDESCITQTKVDKFQTRAQNERVEKNRRILRLLDRLENGEITPEQYERIVAIYNQISFTEGVVPAPPSALVADADAALNFGAAGGGLELGAQPQAILGRNYR
jgi:hypothetical protein